jgi:phage terminase large subunit-like protein
MDDQYQKALNEGAAKQIQFMTKNLNVWTTTSSVWISNSYIESTRLKVDDDILYNKKCFAGLDLASTRDIAALVLMFPCASKDLINHILNPISFAQRIT